MSETSLYPAVKRFLEAASFDVKGEVKGCDIVAVRAGEGLTLIEGPDTGTAPAPAQDRRRQARDQRLVMPSKAEIMRRIARQGCLGLAPSRHDT